MEARSGLTPMPMLAAGRCAPAFNWSVDERRLACFPAFSGRIALSIGQPKRPNHRRDVGDHAKSVTRTNRGRSPKGQTLWNGTTLSFRFLAGAVSILCCCANNVHTDDSSSQESRSLVLTAASAFCRHSSARARYLS